MSTTINIRIDQNLKSKVAKTFASRGLSISTGLKMIMMDLVENSQLDKSRSSKAKKIRQKWDKESAWALKHAKRYDSAREALAEFFKK